MANKSRDKSLGEVIRDARVGTGRSLREFARSMEITPSYQSDIENDRRVPAEDVLKKIAQALGLNFDDLIFRHHRLWFIPLPCSLRFSR